jgi:CheY-like chemotaxis protein
MNGRQLADAARELRPDLHVLFITGYAENAVFRHGHVESGVDVLTKPFAIEELARRVIGLLPDPADPAQRDPMASIGPTQRCDS